MKKRILPILLVMVLLIAALSVTAMATDTPVDPNKVSEYANTEMKGEFGEEYPVSHYCPVCNEVKAWYPLDKAMTSATNITYHHYYLLTDISHVGNGCYVIPSGTTVCMYLNGCDLASESIVFDVVGNLRLIGNGGETVSGYGYGNFNPHGDTFYMSSGSLSLYGGTYTKSSEDSGPVIGSKTAYTLNVYEGTTITGGTNGGNIGGNILLNAENSVLNVYGGIIFGGTATAGGNIAVNAANCQVNISGGIITGGMATTGNGGNISFCGDGSFNMTGGTVSNGTAANWGGNLYTDSYSSINISGGSFTRGSAAANGGNIGINNSSFTFSGGTVSGGSAANGGNIYLHENAVKLATLTITGGTVSDGSATGVGGNIYLNVPSGKAVTVSGLTTTGGTAPNGGNLALYGAGDLNLDNVTVTGGTATGMGGAAYVSSPHVTLTNCTVSGGNVTEKGNYKMGGNFYVDGATGKVTVSTGTTVSGGRAYWGGNFGAHASGTVNIQGGTVSDGIAFSVGGNVYTTSTGVLVANNATITGGEAVTGGNLYISGTATLTNSQLSVSANCTNGTNQMYNSGAVVMDGCTMDGSIIADANFTLKDTTANVITVRGGQTVLAGNTQLANLDLVGDTTLNVKSTFTGEVKLYGLATKPSAALYGETLDSKYAAEGDFTGKLVLYFAGEKPWAFHDNGALVVGNARTVKDGEITWHKNNAMAAQNYGDADMMYPGNHELPLAGGNYVVNLCGLNLDVTGTGTVTFFDTANKDFATYGTATVAETVTVANEFETQVQGLNYYMIQKDGKLSFHRLGVKITGVSIRPGNAGIYYTSAWQCDQLLADGITAYGVAVSLTDQPDENFLTNGNALYTLFTKDTFESGKNMTSVLIADVLKTGDGSNQARAEMPIYATAYITISNGIDTYTVVDGGEVGYSLKQVMQHIDANAKAYLTNKESVDSFYTKWESVMNTWGLENITGTPADPEEDDTLNVLMIGNSYCYYYVQELYDLMAQDGIKANVYNLYKSGCTLEEHYNWWVNDHNGYQFFWKTNDDGYNLVNADKTYVTMADSLLAENWDVISIQESLFKNLQSIDQGSYIAQARVYMDTLIPMLQKAFPNAEIYWHQQFGPEVGFQLGQNSVPDADAQANYVAKAAYLANFAKETYGVKIVNTGDAWAAARANEELVAMLPYGGLCARIGENSFGDKRENAGDGYHDGDIGGGQYLNACVWYETLTGNSCLGKTFQCKTYNNNSKSAAYAPYYELDAAFVALLQEAAHSVPKN